MESVNGVLTLFTNPEVNQSERYPEDLKTIASLEKSRLAVDEISQWPDYHPTPLHCLDNLAADIGVDKIWYKDESQRFHLKSFKALGGAYAVARQLQAKVAEQTGVSPGIKDLLARKYDDIVSQIVISCATDGNHGRSVSWGCQMFGCQCVIYIHRDVSQGRQQAMEAFGATVNRITGNYDESVKQADADAKLHSRIIVSDTSYEGYMEIPKDVALGYTVLLSESVEQMSGEIPTHVFIQGGVGGLASAVCAYFWELWGEQRPRFIIVEPVNANCLQESAKAGSPVVVEGDLDTLMAGLACGEVSQLAWQVLKTGANDFMTINEEAVPLTMKLLANGFNGDTRIEAGESAVAGLAALITARHDSEMSAALGLDDSSRIYILGTEGATDPDVYNQLIDS
ncbi:MAG: diaminopropionate ammonia-lyase [Gammaproteobacteria bacterium]|nr:diaminopropionate ammonia-lyase [Gammaproteobacteria bacterium]